MESLYLKELTQVDSIWNFKILKSSLGRIFKILKLTQVDFLNFKEFFQLGFYLNFIKLTQEGKIEFKKKMNFK